MLQQLGIVLVISFAIGPPSAQRKTLYSGTPEGRKLVAVSVTSTDVQSIIDDLTPYADDNMTLVAYREHLGASELEPVVVFVDRELRSFVQNPRRSTDDRSIREAIDRTSRTVGGGERIGAICVDGTTSSAIGSGACSWHGGVASWRYSPGYTAVDRFVIVAAVCRDLRLVSEDGERCGPAGVLARIQNIDYASLAPAPEPVTPATRTTWSSEPVPASPPPPLAGSDALISRPATEGRISRGQLTSANDSRSLLVLSDESARWTGRSTGNVTFAWSLVATNTKPQSVDAVVFTTLHDLAGETLHVAEELVAIPAGESLAVTGIGSVPESLAARADSWSFDARPAGADDVLVATPSVESPAADEPAATPEPVIDVILEVDLATERVRIINRGDSIIELEGWTLVSTVDNQRLTFDRFARIFPDSALTVTSGPRARSDPGYYMWNRSTIWNSDGDPAELYDENGTLRASTNADGSPRR